MKTGTKSLLFGVHAFWFHPVTVWLAWRDLYGQWPTWRECVCIFIHDWGYWGCAEMDGPEGREHTALGADIAFQLFDDRKALRRAEVYPGDFHYWRFVRYHSRHLAIAHGVEASKLCWPDKTSMLKEWEWFYLLRARLSGEIHEYRKNAIGHLPLSASDRDWLRWLRTRLARLAEQEGAKFRTRAATPCVAGAHDAAPDLPRSTYQTNAARSTSPCRPGIAHTHPESR